MSADGASIGAQATPSPSSHGSSTPSCEGGCNTTERSTTPHSHPSYGASTPTWSAGSAESTNDWRGSAKPRSASRESRSDTRGCSLTGDGPAISGDQGGKSRVMGDYYARFCGGRRVRFPPATRPAPAGVDLPGIGGEVPA